MTFRLARNMLLTDFRFFSTSRSMRESGNKERKITPEKRQYHFKDHHITQFAEKCFANSLKNDDLSSEQAKRINEIKTNDAQIFGFKLKTLKARVGALKRVGLSESNSLLLSTSIPAFYDICHVNFCQVLKHLSRHKWPYMEMLKAHPSLGSVSARRIEKNLKLIDEYSLKDAMIKLTSQHPALLSFPLSKDTLGRIKMVSELNLNYTELLAKAVKRPSSVEATGVNKNLESEVTQQHLIEVEAFLNNYEVKLGDMFSAYPEFVTYSMQDIEQCETVVLSKPFFFTIENVTKLLRLRPDVFMNITDERVKQQIDYIDEISQIKARSFRLLNDRPEIYRYPEKFFERCELLKEFGFTNSDIARLLSVRGATNCFVDCDDFTDASTRDLLSFYSKDIRPIQILVSAPVSLASTFSQTIKQRLSFMRKLGKIKTIAPRKVIDNQRATIQSIVKSPTNYFVENICGSTIEDYEEFSKSFIKT